MKPMDIARLVVDLGRFVVDVVGAYKRKPVGKITRIPKVERDKARDEEMRRKSREQKP